MEGLIEKLIVEPIYLIGAVVLIILLVFALVKKLAKIALLLGLVLIFYLGYLTWTGKQIPETPEGIIEEGKKAIEKVKEDAEEVVKEVIRKEAKKRR
ncbi:MAG: hypothetical protein H8D67_13805 [Deltaproteobacteria bacterium]|nr:hypothetical protein [Deltaproteobacteria bacterium]